jgi:hypothetical protein
METKPFYLSKTFYVNLLALVAVLAGSKVPAVGDFIKNYFSELGAGWAVINMVLRAISKDKLSLG